MNSFYESSYLTWELTSNKNLKFISDTFQHLEYLQENDRNTWKNAETSDYFFQQRPIGGDRPFLVLDLNISTTEFISILLRHNLVSEEEKIFVHDQQMEEYHEQIHKASCFSNPSYAIFFSSENNIVTHIWFDYEDDFSIENDRLAISRLLNELGEKYSFVLIDWYDKQVIDLSNQEMIIQYLNDTADQNDLAQ